MRLDYKELKKDFKRILSQVNKEEIIKWLEEDELRLEVKRRTEKTERLLEIALDKLKENKVIIIREAPCEFGTPNSHASFVDKCPKDFVRRLSRKISENDMFVRHHDGVFYYLDPTVISEFEKVFFEKHSPDDFVGAIELRNSLLYLHEYASYVGESDNFTYIEDGVEIKSKFVEYFKIIK